MPAQIQPRNELHLVNDEYGFEVSIREIRVADYIILEEHMFGKKPYNAFVGKFGAVLLIDLLLLCYNVRYTNILHPFDQRPVILIGQDIFENVWRVHQLAYLERNFLMWALDEAKGNDNLQPKAGHRKG